MKDIRLYYFDLVLRKAPTSFHKCVSIDDAKEKIQQLYSRKYGNWRKYQFVLVEYFDTYNAEIVEIVPKTS